MTTNDLNDIAESLGDRIRKYRDRKGWSQKDLAEKLRVSIGTIGLWEKGKRNPRHYKIIQLSELFNIKVSDLTGEHEGENPSTVSADIEVNHNEGNIIESQQETILILSKILAGEMSNENPDLQDLMGVLMRANVREQKLLEKLGLMEGVYKVYNDLNTYNNRCSRAIDRIITSIAS